MNLEKNNKDFRQIQSLNDQTPPTTSQISNNKPNILKNMNVLNGYVGGSTNGGHVRPIAFCQIMNGTRVGGMRLRMNISQLTPKVPAYQKLKMVVKTFFVPNSRVWKNSEKFESQKGGATEIKIKRVPCLDGKILPVTADVDGITTIPITDTDLWRDSYLSTYIPRWQSGSVDETTSKLPLPTIDFLPIRGFRAIYNDKLRNKEYDEPFEEFDDDDVSLLEFNTSVSQPFSGPYLDRVIIRGRRQNSYYTDYRTELLGDESEFPNLEDSNAPLIDLTEWEKTIAELRSESENAQATDADVMAKIFGTKLLTEGKVQLLHTETIGLNYQQVVQQSYNSADVESGYQTLGAQGAYSFTNVEIPVCGAIQFNESGYIHVIVQVTADSVFETGFDRTLLNVNAFDRYRPDLVEQKNDVLYDLEKSGTFYTNVADYSKVCGYKRKFSEYFKLPNCVQGDITQGRVYKTNLELWGASEPSPLTDELTRFENQRAHAFFEISDSKTGRSEEKSIYKDYTDILLAKNCAVIPEIFFKDATSMVSSKPFHYVRGENQIFYLGMLTMVADLPINQDIKNNFTQFGEK